MQCAVCIAVHVYSSAGSETGAPLSAAGKSRSTVPRPHPARSHPLQVHSPYTVTKLQ